MNDSKKPDIQPFDLTKNKISTHQKLTKMDIISERFVISLRGQLSKLLRRTISISHVDSSLMKSGEYFNSLPIPTYVEILKSQALQNKIAYLHLDTKLVYGFIDMMLGGQHRPINQVKELTKIELTQTQNITKEILNCFNHACLEFFQFQGYPSLVETNPGFCNQLPPSDNLFIFTYEVDIEGLQQNFQIILPKSTIQPAISNLT